MAQYSRPTPDNGRVVSDDDYERLASSYANDGLIGATSDTYPVFADSTGRQVKVRASKLAQVRGYLWGADSADEIVAATTNVAGNPRIDRLVLQLSRTTRNVRTALKTGTAAASPSPPALTQNAPGSGVWEFPLARWQVASGYTTIAAGDIIPEAWYLNPTGDLAVLSTYTQPAGSAIRAGQSMFEVDSGYRYRYTGSKWLRNDDEQLVITNQQWLSTTTFTQLTAANATPSRTGIGLGFPMAANSRYSWELRLQYIGVNGTGLAVRSTFPAGAQLDAVFTGYTSAGGVYNVGTGSITSSPYAPGSFGNSGSTVAQLRVGGMLTTGATAGNFAFEFTQGTNSGANGSWVLGGTSLRHRQVS
jgi:hypothetical protein